MVDLFMLASYYMTTLLDFPPFSFLHPASY